MTPIAFPVRHPSGPQIQKRGNRLHLLAAALIGAHAYGQYGAPGSSPVYFWCQVIIVVDIVLLVLADAQTLRESPAYGIFFRVAELLLFMMACIQYFMAGQWLPGLLQLLVTGLYGWTLYQECWGASKQRMTIQHLGVSLPGENGQLFLPWNRIHALQWDGEAWLVEDTDGKRYRVETKEIPGEEELAAMRQFRQHYIG